MCIYCGSKNYRKIYENHYKQIPFDEHGRSYEIHHIDGNHSNNDPFNLRAVSIKEHYDIHFSQGDWAACLKIAAKMKFTGEELSEIAKKEAARQIHLGIHPFMGKHGSDLAKRVQKELVETKRHHLLRRPDGSSIASDKVKEGTHHFLGGEIQKKSSQQRVIDGTHNWLNGEPSRQLQKQLVAENRHHFQHKKKIECPHCLKEFDAGNYKRYHGNKCKFNPL